MLGFHRRTRSLIPVKNLGKHEKTSWVPEEGEQEEEEFEFTLKPVKANQGQMILIYIIFLAEAIMASSLQAQLKMLIASDKFCGDLSTSYLQSILDSAYAFGGTAGILWGYLADRVGRRRVAVTGLFLMSACCLCMGFATDLASCTLFRFLAGLASASVLVTVVTMIGDISQHPAERAKNISRLPLIAVCGSLGPLVQSMVAGSIKADDAVWQKYPILSSQVACGGLVFLIAVAACLALKDTLSVNSSGPSLDYQDIDSEKAAFLGQAVTSDSTDAPSIHVVDFVRPEPISVSHFLQAPSLIVLFFSFSLLSLHAATFDVLLPHLGHTSTQHGGMGMPCSWLGFTNLAVRAVAGILIFHMLPQLVASAGPLRSYRSCSLLFPVIYIATPALAYLATCSTPLTAAVSAGSLFVKHTLSGSAFVLVTLLVLNAAPDAYSTGTVIGLMHIASLFKALAVAVTGASFYLTNDYSILVTNYALWTSLAVFGIFGAVLAWFVMERPSVETDYPSEVLRWETCFDVDGLLEV